MRPIQDHRRPHKDTPDAELLLEAAGVLPLTSRIVRLGEFLRRHDDDPNPSADFDEAVDRLVRAGEEFALKRYELGPMMRAESLENHEVELAEATIGILRYDRSEDPEGYAIALKMAPEGTAWFRLECARTDEGWSYLAGGTFPNVGLALSSRPGRSPAGNSARAANWSTRVTEAEDVALLALIDEDHNRSDIVHRALVRELGAASPGMTIILMAAEDVARGLPMLERNVIQGLVKRVRGGEA